MLRTWVQRASVSALLFVCSFGYAQMSRAEQITRFDVRANLNHERHLTINETIEYDFGPVAQTHSILRVLPERYRRTFLNYDLRYKVEQVLMDGAPIFWEREDQGADLVLRMGNSTAAVTGTHRYEIRYTTDWAINDSGDVPELYWNVTGNDWPVSIKRASFSFEGVPIQHQRCFTGPEGAVTSACSFRPSRDPSQVTADSPALLDAHEGFAVVLEFSKNVLANASLQDRIVAALMNNPGIFVSLLICVLMCGIWFVWGRDPRGRGVVVAQYEAPDELTPALLTGLVEEEVSTRAITATLLDLARRGYTKLELVGPNPAEPDKVLYRRLAPSPTGVLLPYEAALLEAVFVGRSEVDLKKSGSQGQWIAYQRVLKTVADEMIQRGWFLKNPGTVRGGWLGLAFGMVFVAFAFHIFPLIFAGVVVGVLGWQMPRMTPLAAEVYERILGFKLFLKMTEKERLAFSDMPAKRPEQFAEFLPAAIALGVEQPWAKQFEGLLVAPPTYIQGGGANWGSLTYVHVLTHVGHSVASGMTHQTRVGRGGSGFSSDVGGGSR